MNADVLCDPGTVVRGLGGATNSIELQKPELRKYLPEIDECRSGTINVYLHAPLDVRIPDIVTPPIAWQPGHPPERFALTKVELEVLEQRHEAWIYVAELSPHRFNYIAVEILARPIDGVTRGLACSLHIERIAQGICVI
jgi:hypothetical protein